MTPISDDPVRKAFVNLSKGASGRVNLAPDLEETAWEDLDFFGWTDPKAPASRYLVTTSGERPQAVAMRISDGAPTRARKTMCDLCTTVGSAVLMVAPRAGKAGQRGDSVGVYICDDLACSLFARGKRSNGTLVFEESLSVEQKVARLEANLRAFLARVVAP